MKVDQDKIDETTLAILLLTIHDERRVWKNIDWGVLDSLYEKGYISDPKNKSKSVNLSDDGLKKAEEVFKELFEDKNQCT